MIALYNLFRIYRICSSQNSGVKPPWEFRFFKIFLRSLFFLVHFRCCPFKMYGVRYEIPDKRLSYADEKYVIAPVKNLRNPGSNLKKQFSNRETNEDH